MKAIFKEITLVLTGIKAQTHSWCHLWVTPLWCTFFWHFHTSPMKICQPLTTNNNKQQKNSLSSTQTVTPVAKAACALERGMGHALPFALPYRSVTHRLSNQGPSGARNSLPVPVTIPSIDQKYILLKSTVCVSPSHVP